MITREQAAQLRHGEVIHCGECRVTSGPRGGKTYTMEQWRVTGKMQTWKRNPAAFRVPLKHGLGTFGELSHHTNHQFHLVQDCPVLQEEAAHRKTAKPATPDELTEFSDSREEPNGPEPLYQTKIDTSWKYREEVYPITAKLIEDAGPVVGIPAVQEIIETVGEYEHGTAEVEDCHKNLTLEMYAAVALDLILMLKNRA